jgi:hypothetical protein
MTFVVKTALPGSLIHIVSDKNPELSRCGEELHDYLEVPRGKLEIHDFCPKCLEAK